MKTTIDGAGRLVVPKAIRELAGLEPGMQLEVSYRDGRIEIEPAPRDVRVVSRGRIRVAVPLDPSTPLDDATVSRARDELRRGHE
jgi:AbrB family looped-hinge helix DNA binding protein